MLRTLHRLRERLEARGYLPGDRYYDVVAKAEGAMHTLCVKTHYASCEGGVAGANETAQSKPE
jgi:hypothetical protein